MNSPYVLIVGAGLYGCHAAMTLKKMGINFKVADIANDFFQGSSSKNQNRLHQGFHYARSYTTRHECMNGYMQFIDTYPFAAKVVDNNLYFVDKKSIMDFKTYKHIYEHEQVPFNIVSNPKLPFIYEQNAFDGNGDAFLTSERFVDFNELKCFFTDNLGEYLIQDYKPALLCVTPHDIHCAASYDSEKFTHLLDCTYFQLNIPDIHNQDMFYELCIAFLYKYVTDENVKSESFAFTVMDGPFFSIYPYDMENQLYTLTDVERTPLIKTKELNEVYALKDTLTESDIKIIQNTFETNVKKYIPEFNNHFQYHGYYLALKTKPNLQSDDRSLMYVQVGHNVHRFSGGKLTGIFPMEAKLKQLFQIGDITTEH